MESKFRSRLHRRSLARWIASAFPIGLLMLVNLFCPFVGIGHAQPVVTNISEFPILSTPYASPYGITYGPDGNFWFVEYYSSRIGTLNTASNTITDVLVTNQGSFPINIVSAPDTNLWFTITSSNRLGRMSPITTNYVTFTLPTSNAVPGALIVGPDNNLWFSEYGISKIAMITTSPTVSGTNNLLVLNREFGPFRFNSQITGMTFGPDGNLWFVDGTYGIITMLNTNTGATNEYFLPNTNCTPSAITVGPDGNLWFTELNTNQIGRITTNGSITEYTLPTIGGVLPRPYDIILGQDGNLWFTESFNSAVGKITTNGIVTIYQTPTAGSNPTCLCTGRTNNMAFLSNNVPGDTNIWFCELVGGQGSIGSSTANIARLNLATALDLETTNALDFQPSSNVVTNFAVFKNSRQVNTITLNWGDQTISTLTANNLTNTGATISATNLSNSIITVTCVTPIDTNFNVGTFTLSYTHTYSKRSNYIITNTIMDNANFANMAVASIRVAADPFFDGQIMSSANIYYLVFPNGNVFNFYNYNFFPYLYHYNLGFEYFISANDSGSGAYFYDFTSGHFWYTNPSLYPYIYDFSLNAWLYYYPGSPSSREFYNFSTASFIFQ